MSNNKFSTVTDGDSGCVLLTWPSLRTVHHFPSLHIYFSCYRAVYLVIVALFRLWLTLNWWLDSIALRPIHHSIVNRAEGHSRFFRMLLSCRGHSFYWRLFSLLIPSMGSNLQWRSRRRCRGVGLSFSIFVGEQPTSEFLDDFVTLGKHGPFPS